LRPEPSKVLPVDRDSNTVDYYGKCSICFRDGDNGERLCRTAGGEKIHKRLDDVEGGVRRQVPTNNGDRSIFLAAKRAGEAADNGGDA